MANPETPPRSFRTVVLRHETPDGEHHFDWMLDSLWGEPGSERTLMTFRLRESPVSERAPEMSAERLPNHRALYLTFEGDLTGGRGRVTRVAEGEIRFVVSAAAEPSEFEFECRFAGVPGWERWSARGGGTGRANWTLTRLGA